METPVVVVVLVAALLHATWNALVKVAADRLSAMTLVAMSAGLLAAATLPFVGPPPGSAWPALAVSLGLHLGYKLFLIRAYAHGDLGQVYPLARGAAPLLVLGLSVLWVGETLAATTLGAVVLLTAGVASLALRGGRLPIRSDPRPVAYALGTACFIGGYTVVDGLGARLAPSPHVYAAWLFALDGLPMLAIALWRRPGALRVAATRYWRPGIAGGACSLAAYWLVIWAMTRAPMAPVAALRETSVLFAGLIAVVALRERPGAWRIAATILVLAGVVLLRL